MKRRDGQPSGPRGLNRQRWEAAQGRPCPAARMTFPEYLLERARSVALTAFVHESRGGQPLRGDVAKLEEICAEMLDEVRRRGA